MPFPAVEKRLEIPAVTLPHRHDVAAQAFFILAVLVNGCDKSFVLALVAVFKRGKIIFDTVAGNSEVHLVVFILLAKNVLDVVFEFAHGLLGEWHVAKVFRKVHFYGVVNDFYRLCLKLPYAHVLGEERGNHFLNIVFLDTIDFGCLGAESNSQRCDAHQ